MEPARHLEGITLSDGWYVKEILSPKPNATGGRFSIGYLVEKGTGQQGYLKALDFSAAFQNADPIREIQAMTEAYNFERDLLEKCRGLKRVVKAISFGNVRLPNMPSQMDTVFYLIFELARGDIRSEIANTHALDLAWCLRTIHQAAVGLRSLHNLGIAHQDLKPSNVLVYANEGSRIADLGRAHDLRKACATDFHAIPGDRTYVPPEFCNSSTPAGRTFEDRCLADLYHLGSLFFFFFSNCSTTHALFAKTSARGIPFNARPENLPYINDAFAQTLEEFRRKLLPLAGSLTEDIIDIAKQLCEPDPARRGDVKNIGTHVPRHSLERFISRLDLLARKAEYNLYVQFN